MQLSTYEHKDFQLASMPWSLIAVFAILKLLFHVFFLQGYGPHADELYYISLSDRFSLGFLDISPFVTWIGRISVIFFGNSVTAFRMLPVAFSVLTLLLTGLLTHYMGGKRLAIIISCTAMLFSPAFLATSYLLQPVVFDEFFWVLLAFSIIRFTQTSNKNFIYLASVTLAMGLMNKYTIVLYLFSALIGFLLLNKNKLKISLKELTGPSIVFLLLISPHLVWQINYGFPLFNYVAMVGKGSYHIDLPDYLFQVLLFHGAGVAIWSAGLLYLFLDYRMARFKIWGIALLLVLFCLAFLKGKLYYGLGAFPVLFAAGGCSWANMLYTARFSFRVFFIATLSLFGLLSLPLVIPILPDQLSRSYNKSMVDLTNFKRPMRWEDGGYHNLPQFFADMSGWKQVSTRLAKINVKLKSNSKFAHYVLTDSYAIAGALTYYAEKNSLKVISGNNSYILRSPDQLPLGSILFLSKDPIQDVSLLAKKVLLMDTILLENSHLNGIHIYLLDGLSEKLKQRYANQRSEFLKRY